MKQNISRREFLSLMGVSGAALLLTRCAPPGPPVVEATPSPVVASQGGAGIHRPVVRMAAGAPQGVFEFPQPFGFRTGPAFARASYIFDTLTWRDSTLDTIPWLASEWSSNNEGTEWIFVIRQGVTFHDGQPLTVDDIVFSYQYIQSNATNWYSSMAQVLEGIEALDGSRVRITLKNPFAPFLNSIASQVLILPQHIWSGVTEPERFTEQAAFIGSGPYKLESFQQTDHSFLFTAYDEHFLGIPYVQRIEYIPAGDDLVALMAGNIDMASPFPVEGLPNEALDVFRNDPRFAVLEAPGEAVVALHFNQTHGQPYDNVLFRQGVIYGIDRQEIIDRIMTGNATPGSAGFLAPSNPYANPELENYAYDPERAMNLFEQAGLAGQDLSINLLFASNLVRTAELVQDQLARVGVQVNLRPVDPGTANQMQGEGNYEAALVTYGGLGGDPDFMRRAFSSPPEANFWWKAWGYANPDFSQLAQQQVRTIEEARRRELVHEMQQILAQEVPVMPLYYPNRYVIYNPQVFDNWYYTPVWNPLPVNRHLFVTGRKTGLEMRTNTGG